MEKQMSTMFSKPKIGSIVTVVSDWSDLYKGYASGVPRQNQNTGTVVISAKYDDPNSFRMTTDDKTFPIRVISLDHVVSLVYDDGSKGDKRNIQKTEINVWEVKSDSRKGGTYTVTRNGGIFDCTCVGYGFRRTCRHVNQIKAKVA